MDQLQAVGQQLGVDQTFIPMFGIMIVLYFVLSSVYLKPFQELLMNRKQKTAGAKTEANELSQTADQKMNQYRESIKKINEQAHKSFLVIEEEAKKEEAKYLADASLKARNLIQAANKEIDEQKKAVIKDLTNEIPAIANEIATIVLGRKV